MHGKVHYTDSRHDYFLSVSSRSLNSDKTMKTVVICLYAITSTLTVTANIAVNA